MKNQKKTIPKALMAAIEATLMVLPLGILFFYPFILEYELLTWMDNVLYAGGIMLVFSLGISLLILVPTTTFIETTRKNVSRQELAGSLGTISLILVLGSTLAYKGFDKPGEQGKLLLFGLLMAIMLVTYTFTVRYKHRTRDFSTENQEETNT